MAAEEDKGAAQAPPPQAKQKVYAAQCTVEGGAEIKIYASSSCATAAAWAGALASVVIAVGTLVLGVVSCENTQTTRQMFLADNLPVFIIEGGWNRNAHELGITMTNQGKGPAHMRFFGLVHDEVIYPPPDWPEEKRLLREDHRYYVPAKAMISYPSSSFDAFAQEYAKQKDLGDVSGFENLLQKQPGLFSGSNPITCWIEYADVSKENTYGQVFRFKSEKDAKGNWKYTVIPGRYYSPKDEKTPKEARPGKTNLEAEKATKPAQQPQPDGAPLQPTDLKGEVDAPDTISKPAFP